MSWELLDIRKGRANRLQFFVALIVLSIVDFLVSIPIQSNLVSNLSWCISFYLFLTMILRRSRDLGTDDWSTKLVCIFLFLPSSLIFLIKLSFDSSVPIIAEASAVLTLLFVMFAFPILIISFVVFCLLFLKRCDPNLNQYGFPPEGLNFKSMVSTGYSQEQLDEINNASNTQYVSKNTEYDPIQYDVKGRNL